MSESNDAEKTEDPTQKRIDETREKGQTAFSREVLSMSLFLALLITLMFIAPNTIPTLAMSLASYFENLHSFPSNSFELTILLTEQLKIVFVTIIPFGFLVMFLIIISSLGQNGPIWARKKIIPDLKHLDPIKGFKKIFSLNNLVELIKGIIKMTLVFSIGVILMIPLSGYLEIFISMPVNEVLSEISKYSLIVILGSFAIMVPIAFADFIFQKMQNLKQIRMTRQEVKDEHKMTEGNPEVQARIRNIRQARMQQMLSQQVKESDVLITNPTHFAVALKYEMEQMQAPAVTAKGQDYLALHMREMAKKYNIPIWEDPPLARTLYDTTEIGEFINEEHYYAVSEVIKYVYKLKGKQL